MISRKQFIRAIQAGITASPSLTERERDALRQVAVSSKHTGNGYDSGCPWTQALGDSPPPLEGRKFAYGYDNAMWAASSPYASVWPFNQPVID